MLKKTLALLLALTMLVALLASCGSSSPDSKDDTKTDNATEVKKDDNKTTGSDSSQPSSEIQDITVTVMAQTSWGSFDNYEATNSGAYQRYWGNQLMFYDFSAEFKPELAKSWEWADDYSSITFYLQDNVYFYKTGNKLTAEDVKYTYMYYVENPNAYNTLVSGYVESIDVIDELTVRFNLKAASPIMYEAWGDIPIVDSAVCSEDRAAYFEFPYGSGGWQFTEVDKVSYSVTMELWEDSWQWAWYETDPFTSDLVNFKTPNFKTMKFLYNPEEASRVSALRSGEAQVCRYISYDQFGVLESEGLVTSARPAINFTQLPFVCKEGHVFYDINLRKAASYAIDRQAILDSIFGGMGEAYTYPTRKGFMGWRDEPVYEYDPDYAKELVSEYYDGSTVTMIICESYVASATEVSQAAQAMLNSAGFNVDLKILESATYQPMFEAGEYDVAYNDLGGSMHENLKFYYEIWGTADRFKMGTVELSPRMTELADAMFTEMDIDKETEMRDEFFAIQAELYGPMILLYTGTAMDAYSPVVENIVLPPIHTWDSMMEFIQYVG